MLICAGMLVATLFACQAMAQASDVRQKRLVVASFGGQLDNVYRTIFKKFEEVNGVTIVWVPGTAPGNVAKLAATRTAPEYDLVLFENVTQRLASTQGLLAPIDTGIVTNYKDLSPRARPKGGDGAAIGSFVTGIYYRRDEFKKRGWAVPSSWNDLSRPELCGYLGLERPGQVHTLSAVLMLGGGNPGHIDQGIARYAALAKCARVLEPAAAKHEEKILMGEYPVGVYSSIRTLPLIKRVPAIAFVLPKEGAIVSSTMVAAVKGAPNARMAQAFINWFLSPQSQAELVRQLFYSPANTHVDIPQDLLELGIPDQKTLARMPVIDDDLLVAHRRDWTRKMEQALEN